MMRRWLGCLAMAWLLLTAGPAQALCTAICVCNVTTTALAFGAINPLAASASDSTGSVKVNCGGVAGLLIPYRIDLGAGASGNASSRRLMSGARSMQYNLYQDSSRQTVWGDGNGLTQALNGGVLLDALGLSPGVVHPVYGRVPGAQSTTVPGSYADTVTVTLSYF